jgi:hypothetical protein
VALGRYPIVTFEKQRLNTIGNLVKSGWAVLKNGSRVSPQVALAALGMLATLACCLAIDVFGPVCDNAGGRLRRGHFVIVPPHIAFVRRIPIGTANVSDE